MKLSKLTTRLVTCVAAGALALGVLAVTGCSSEEQTNTAPQQITTADIDAQDIEISGVGFTVVDETTVNYAFTVNNPNDGYIADGVTFTIEGYSEDGTMLIGGGETIQEIYPGVETAAAGTAFLPEGSAEIARFEVQPLMEHVNWTQTNMTNEEINNMFQISNVEATEAEGQMTFTGTVSADLGEADAESGISNRQDVHLVVLLLDANGDILGGGSSMGIMLDPTMNYAATTPADPALAGNTEADAEALDATAADDGAIPDGTDQAIVEPEPIPYDENGTTAMSNFVINISGVFPYADYKIIATPGI